MEELHKNAVTAAQREKATATMPPLLARLAEDDYRGLVLNLSVEHEPRARHRKLRHLCRRYLLAEEDYEGLALSLAIQHEPEFRVLDRQIAEPQAFGVRTNKRRRSC